MRDSASYISPYSQRDHAWNDAAHNQSDEVKWSGETNTTAPNSLDWVENGQGIHSRLFPGDPTAVLAQKRHVQYHDRQSSISAYNQSDDAWTNNQADKTNETEWAAHINAVGADYLDSANTADETITPNDAEVASLVQKGIYPVRDSASYITPYSQRDHAWNDAQHNQSDEVKWSGETNTTAPNSLDWVENGQGIHSRLFPGDPTAVLAQKKHVQYHDRQSTVSVYDQRSDAWTDHQADKTNEASW